MKHKIGIVLITQQSSPTWLTVSTPAWPIVITYRYEELVKVGVKGGADHLAELPHGVQAPRHHAPITVGLQQ